MSSQELPHSNVAPAASRAHVMYGVKTQCLTNVSTVHESPIRGNERSTRCTGPASGTDRNADRTRLRSELLIRSVHVLACPSEVRSWQRDDRARAGQNRGEQHGG